MKRIRKPKNLKTTMKIHIACEGESEYYYVQSLLKEYKLNTDHITFSLLGGQGYKNADNYYEKNKSLYRVFIFILDLDIASKKKSEKASLNRLINKIQKDNLNNTIFLSNPDFEVFVAANIGISRSNLERLDYKKGNGVYKFIKNNNGDFEKSKFNIKGPYYLDKKKPGKVINPNEHNLNNDQSSLVYIIDYLRELIENK